MDDELQKLLGEDYESIISTAEDIKDKINKREKGKSFLKKIFLPLVFNWSKIKSYYDRRMDRYELKNIIKNAENYSFNIWQQKQLNQPFEEYCRIDLKILSANLKYNNKTLDITPWMQIYFCKSGRNKLSQIKEYIDEFCKKYNIISNTPFLLEIDYMNPRVSFKVVKIIIDFENNCDLKTGYEWHFDEFKFI